MNLIETKDGFMLFHSLSCGCVENKQRKKGSGYSTIDFTICEKHQPYLTGYESMTERSKILRKVRSREYYNNNREKCIQNKKDYDIINYKQIRESRRVRREHNKDMINEERRNNKVNCPCGGIYRFDDKNRHYRTTKHQDFMNKVNVKVDT